MTIYGRRDVGTLSKKCINMEEKIVNVINAMAEYLSVAQMKKLQEVLLRQFSENEAKKEIVSNAEYLKMFLNAKMLLA